MFSAPVRLPPFNELVVSLSQPQPQPQSYLQAPSHHQTQSFLLYPVPFPSPRTSLSSHSATPGYSYNSASRYFQPLGIMMPVPLKPAQEQQQVPTRLPSTRSEIPTPPASTELLKDASPKPEPTTKRTHACKTCGRAFTTLGHLARHNRTHTGERKHVCPWPQCGARFARQDNCMQHFKMHLNGKSRRRARKTQN